MILPYHRSDKVSEELFALKTYGAKSIVAGSSASVLVFEWSASSANFKAIFIAGNERLPGPVNYRLACNKPSVRDRCQRFIAAL